MRLMKIKPAIFSTKIKMIKQDELQKEGRQVKKVAEYLLIVKSPAILK